ncbi:MAG: hypothetical protein E5X74_00815 [Mesorhizobium sp.]|nr:hypothetical protein [Mesorhizobium sp.]TIO87591.1 MAG: hypothetical protein E5X74_00815 [Mesorhizobium sp.]
MISDAYKSRFNNLQGLDRLSVGHLRDICRRSASGMQPMCLPSISDTRRRVPNVGRIGQNLLSG